MAKSKSSHSNKGAESAKESRPTKPPISAKSKAGSKSSSKSKTTSGRSRGRRSSTPNPADAAPADGGETIRIRKYPNRRMYDTSRSRHITQDELYEFVASGGTVQVVDSRTGEDITNQTLATALIEHDPEKIQLFPTWMLHYMIRTREQTLVQFFNRYWSHLVGAFMAAQPGGGGGRTAGRGANAPASATGMPFPFPGMPNMPGMPNLPNIPFAPPGGNQPAPDPATLMTNPWAWFEAMARHQQSPPPSDEESTESEGEDDVEIEEDEALEAEPADERDDEIAELQREVAELARRLTDLTADRSPKKDEDED